VGLKKLLMDPKSQAGVCEMGVKKGLSSGGEVKKAYEEKQEVPAKVSPTGERSAPLRGRSRTTSKGGSSNVSQQSRGP